MNNGIIYPIVKSIVDGINTFNLVELFKFVAKKLNPDKNNQAKEKAYERVAVDVFIILKWFFLFVIWFLNITNLCITIVVWYLIITNLYTYFFRHVWCDDAFTPPTAFTIERVRRRFVNLILAFAFSNLSFAYLYNLPYAKNMTWGTKLGPSALHSLWFSMSNSVAANYTVVAPFNGIGNSVAMIQLAITFIFVTIIISRSIPQAI